MTYSNPRRLFKGKERLVLLADSGGRCRLCGADLWAGFHADHITPFSHGGATDVINGQALCPSCNRGKGAKIPAAVAVVSQDSRGATAFADLVRGETQTPASAGRKAGPPSAGRKAGPPSAGDKAGPHVHWTTQLRRWQQQGVDRWLNLRAQAYRDMMVVASPGAGKTDLALFLARLELAAGRCDLVVIVVPTRQLKRQWARAAHRVGIILTSSWGNGAAGLPAELDGVLITYSQLARLPEAARLLCGRHRVFAILDELHHGGDGLSWGDGLREGFEEAEARLCLSGTPFRSDHLCLPFARYDCLGRVASDVCYTYAQALADGVVRQTFFHACGGSFQWRDSDGIQSSTFADRLGEARQARRLRAALDASGNWLTSVLRRADLALRAARRTHARAKAFVVCMDAGHARAVARLLGELTGEAPTLALSDNPDAAEALERFRRDESGWLVVCKMAGEGFDCPDLRVCVWATNVISELFFRQVVGRVLRMVNGLPYQDGTVYLPADARLMAMASSFMDEPGGLELGSGLQGDPFWGGAPAGAASGCFAVLSSEAAGVEVLSSGGVIPESALRDALDLKATRPFLADLPDHYVAAMLAAVEAGERAFEETELSGEGARAAPAVLGASLDTSPDAGGAVSDADGVAISDADGVADAGMETGGESTGYNGEEPYAGEETYDERVARLRQDCRRLTALIACELNAPAMEIERFYRKHLGFGQAGATLAQLEHKHDVLRRKAGELRMAVD